MMKLELCTRMWGKAPSMYDALVRQVMENRNKSEELTIEIANMYHARALKLANYGYDVGEQRKLRIELCELFGATELEAINILRGFHIMEYIQKYERMRQGIEIDNTPIREEFVEIPLDDWLLQKLADLEHDVDGK